MPVGVINAGPISVADAEFHDTTHSPVGLWQLNGGLTDVSGNGNDLSLNNGTERYGPAAKADSQAFFFDGSTDLVSSAVAVLQIAGDVTLELLVFPNTNSNTRYACTCADAGEAEGDNHLYGMRLEGNNLPTVFMEQNAGSNIPFQVTDESIPLGQWSHLAYVRNGTTHSLYRNGTLIGSSSAVGLPTKGGSPVQRLFVGGNESGSERWAGLISSIKIVSSALTAAQVLAEAQRTLPHDLRP